MSRQHFHGVRRVKYFAQVVTFALMLSLSLLFVGLTIDEPPWPTSPMHTGVSITALQGKTVPVLPRGAPHVLAND